MDVKSAFLNGYLEEEVYVEQPQVFEVEGKENNVYKLKKAFCDLKQAPRVWYTMIDSYLLENRFEKCEGEPTLYIKEKEENRHLVSTFRNIGYKDQEIKKAIKKA